MAAADGVLSARRRCSSRGGRVPAASWTGCASTASNSRLLPELVFKQPPAPDDRDNEIDPRQCLRPATRRSTRRSRSASTSIAREAFGMTEIGSGLFMPIEATDMVGSGSCGMPSPFREARIVDEDDSPVPPGDDRRAAGARPRHAAGLLQQARGDRGRAAGRLVPHRRPVPPGRARLLLHRRPDQGHDPPRRREHRRARGRGRAARPAARSSRPRPCRCRTTRAARRSRSTSCCSPGCTPSDVPPRADHRALRGQPRAVQGAALHRLQRQSCPRRPRRRSPSRCWSRASPTCAPAASTVSRKVAMTDRTRCSSTTAARRPMLRRKTGAASGQLPPRLPASERRRRARRRRGRAAERLPRRCTSALGARHVVVKARDLETTFGFRIRNEDVAAFCREHGPRFIGFAGVDPHKGMTALRELEFAVTELGLRGLNLQCFETQAAHQRPEDVPALRQVHRARHPGQHPLQHQLLDRHGRWTMASRSSSTT